MRVYWGERKSRQILILSTDDGKELEVGGVRLTPRGYDAFAKATGYDPGRARRGLSSLEEAKAFVESFRPWEIYQEGVGLEVEPEVVVLTGDATSGPTEDAPSEPATKEQKSRKQWWEFWKKK